MFAEPPIYGVRWDTGLSNRKSGLMVSGLSSWSDLMTDTYDLQYALECEREENKKLKSLIKPLDLSKWTIKEVVDALSDGGYDTDDIISAEFVGMNDYGKAMFDITFEDDAFGDVGHGRVFVGFNSRGVLVGEY